MADRSEGLPRLTAHDHDLAPGFLAQEVLDEVVGQGEHLGGCEGTMQGKLIRPRPPPTGPMTGFQTQGDTAHYMETPAFDDKQPLQAFRVVLLKHGEDLQGQKPSHGLSAELHGGPSAVLREEGGVVPRHGKAGFASWQRLTSP